MALKIDSIYWNSMKTKALFQKMNTKIDRLDKQNSEHALYSLIASSFGMGVNIKPFEELAQSLPWNQISELSSEQRLQLILVSSGWMNDNYSHGRGTDSRWHFRGTRPANFPTNRIPQFATFVAEINMFELIRLMEQQDPFINFMLLCQQRFKSNCRAQFPRNLLYSIAINALAPFLWYLSEKTQNEIYQERAINLLEGIPAENNSVVKNWKKIGVRVKTALDTQGLLALNRYYCSCKKCLSCEVGVIALDRRI